MTHIKWFREDFRALRERLYKEASPVETVLEYKYPVANVAEGRGVLRLFEPYDREDGWISGWRATIDTKNKQTHK